MLTANGRKYTPMTVAQMNSDPYQSPQHSGGSRESAGQFAGCPTCGNVYATKINFTFWGGLLGPKLFHHVKCTECGTKYNGKSGKSNLVPIIIYSVVGFLISLVLIIAVLRIQAGR